MISRDIYTMRQLEIHDLDNIMELQDTIFKIDTDCEEWLRRNNRATFEEILTNKSHHAIGHYINDDLVSVGVLYDAQLTDENIAKYITNDETELMSVINFKVVFLSTIFRGNGLAREIVQHLREYARELGKTKIYCTIHHMNTPSKILFQSLGYEKICNVETSYGAREIWCFEF